MWLWITSVTIFSSAFGVAPGPVQRSFKLISNWSLQSRSKMAKIGALQNSLEDLFDECTPQFLNKRHSIQLEYRVQKKSRILVIARIFRRNPETALLKSAMYVRDDEDVNFLRAYLSGLVLTLAIEYV